jgi:lipoprotein-releasing system permease protein
MQTSFYIARRLAFNEKKTFSRFIIRLAIVAVALSVCIMIIGSSITRGYQKVIQDKFYNCWGQIHITPFLADPSNLLQSEYLDLDSTLYTQLQKVSEIKSIQPYLLHTAILYHDENMEGLLLKGIRKMDTSLFTSSYLIEGRKIHYKDTGYSNELLLSKTTADLLHVGVGDDIVVYFLREGEEQPRARKLTISGIFKTGLEDFDKTLAICDISLLQHIHQHKSTTISGYEIYVNNNQQIQLISHNLYNSFIKEPLHVYPITTRFASIFSWLDMMKVNEKIILLIMLIIAMVNMITALLILILERTRMIGLLKAIGMPNGNIQQVFLFSSLGILTIGISVGTFFGIGLCMLQEKFGFIHLDESTYYIKTVPIFIQPSIIFMILSGTFILGLLLLFIPTIIIRTISPIKALLFR